MLATYTHFSTPNIPFGRHCAPACLTCHLLDFDHRCPPNPDAPQVWTKEGDLDNFFLHLLERLTSQSFRPIILSTPSDFLSSLWDNPSVTVSDEVINDGPWILAIESFLSEAECNRLIELGHQAGYRRSRDVGKPKFDGSYGSSESNRRTSTNAWCNGDCFADPTAQTITNRLEELLRIPTDHSEYLQLLRYEEGQQYKEHHDYIDFQRERNEGVRILTVFMYLNSVESGGGTQFPRLGNLTITPQTGKVLIWPNVLDSQPNHKDLRTKHRALPVVSGIKFGANAWIHQSDFRTPHRENCA